MGQLSPRWTLAGMEARGCLMADCLSQEALRGAIHGTAIAPLDFGRNGGARLPDG